MTQVINLTGRGGRDIGSTALLALKTVLGDYNFFIGFEKALHKKTEQSGKICMGIFGCKGFDTFDPLKLIGGLNKNRANEKDFKNAIDFLKKIL